MSASARGSTVGVGVGVDRVTVTCSLHLCNLLREVEVELVPRVYTCDYPPDSPRQLEWSQALLVAPKKRHSSSWTKWRRPLATRRCPGRVRMLPGPASRRSRCTRRPRRQNLRLARPSAPFSRWSSPHLCFDDTLAARLESKRRCSCSLYDGAAHSTSPGRASASRTSSSAQTQDLGLSLTSDMLKSTVHCRRMRTRTGILRG